MKILLNFLTFIIGLNKMNGECELNFDPSFSPIIIGKDGNEFLLFSKNHTKLGQNNYLYAVCTSGFQAFNYEELDQSSTTYTGYDNTMLLKCINGKLKIQIDNRFLNIKSLLNCKNPEKSEILEGSFIEKCDKKFYTINLNIGNLSFDYAGVCFDLDNMRIDYLHYVTRQLKPISYQQFKYNENLQSLKKTEAPSEIFFMPEHQANELIENIIGHRPLKSIQFKYEEFYPSNYWYPQMPDPFRNANTLNRFLGWTNFIDGNWRLFRNLLASRSINVTYDVYLGTSDVVVAPFNDDIKNMKELSLKAFYNRVTTVPKYVWTYLKSKGNESDEFVVIGVNSPYFELYPRTETIFCNDICKEIKWFSPLENFRKLYIFGYMFCCRKEQVQDRLNGFPRIKLPIIVKKNNSEESTSKIGQNYDDYNLSLFL